MEKPVIKIDNQDDGNIINPEEIKGEEDPDNSEEENEEEPREEYKNFIN